MRAVILILLGATVWIGGCAGQSKPAPMPQAIAPQESIPGDFWIEMTIPQPAQAVAGKPGSPRVLHYVVLPDATLRYADHAPAGDGNGDSLPPVVRRLSRSQMDQLWNLARKSRGAATDAAGNLAPPQDAAAILVSAGGERWLAMIPPQADASQSSAVRTLADHLHALAWSPEPAVDPSSIAPERHDFGPDPYARYRRARP